MSYHTLDRIIQRWELDGAGNRAASVLFRPDHSYTTLLAVSVSINHSTLPNVCVGVSALFGEYIMQYFCLPTSLSTVKLFICSDPERSVKRETGGRFCSDIRVLSALHIPDDHFTNQQIWDGAASFQRDDPSAACDSDQMSQTLLLTLSSVVRSNTLKVLVTNCKILQRLGIFQGHFLQTTTRSCSDYFPSCSWCQTSPRTSFQKYDILIILHPER